MVGRGGLSKLRDCAYCFPGTLERDWTSWPTRGGGRTSPGCPRAGSSSSWATSATPVFSTGLSLGATPSSTAPPRPATTAPSPTPSRSCARTWRGRFACWRRFASMGFATTTSRRTRSTATWPWTAPRASPRGRPIGRALPTAPRRPHRTCSCAPGPARTA